MRMGKSDKGKERVHKESSFNEAKASPVLLQLKYLIDTRFSDFDDATGDAVPRGGAKPCSRESVNKSPGMAFRHYTNGGAQPVGYYPGGQAVSPMKEHHQGYDGDDGGSTTDDSLYRAPTPVGKERRRKKHDKKAEDPNTLNGSAAAPDNVSKSASDPQRPLGVIPTTTRRPPSPHPHSLHNGEQVNGKPQKLDQSTLPGVHWREEALQATSGPIFVYRNQDGAREVVLPSTPDNPPFATFSPNGMSDANFCRPQHADGVSWNPALTEIVESDFDGPAVRNAIMQRLTAIREKDDRPAKQARAESIANSSMATNFSSPISRGPDQGGPSAYVRFPREVNGAHDADECREKPRQPYPTPSFTRPRVNPTGLPTAQEFEATRSILNYPPTSSSPGETAERLRAYEGTITTQAKLIRNLHGTIDELVVREEAFLKMLPQADVKLEAQGRQISSLKARLKKADSQNARIKKMKDKIVDLELDRHELSEDVGNLKIALDFAYKALGGSWERTYRMYRTMHEMENTRRMQLTRRPGLLRRIFKSRKPVGGGLEDASGDEALSEGYKWNIFGKTPDSKGAGRAKQSQPADQDGDEYTQTQNPPDRNGNAHENENGNGTVRNTRGSPRESFGSSPNHSWTAEEMDALMKAAKRNHVVLENDIKDLIKLIKVVTRDVTGIEPHAEDPKQE